METMRTHFKPEVLNDGVQLLTFDSPDSSANVFNREALSELITHLEAMAENPSIHGLIFMSAKPSIFIAGADLREIARIGSEAELLKIITLGQLVFNDIADLPIPTVAAIHGACLGGGYELCLACDYRIASNDPSTKIGLPETMLGLLPAWGGSTRLPRLIGLPNALDIILRGRRLAAAPALRRGMIDAVVPREYLIRTAMAHIAKGKPTRKRHTIVNNPFAGRLISSRARAQVKERTRGNFPAIPKALEVATAGVSMPRADSLALEREAIIELVKTPACHNLVEMFFLQERAKRRRPVPGINRGLIPPIGHVAVIGAGVMGAGIAQWVSAKGHTVVLRDVNETQVLKGMAIIADLYNKGVEHHEYDKLSARQSMDRIYPCAGEVPLNRADLVIEAAVEDMAVKKQIFQQLTRQIRNDAVLATNTSALSVSDLATVVKNPERVIGMHFFNPVHRMQLVEVVLGAHTTHEVMQRVVLFVQRIGKLPVVVKDSPGFLVNRVLLPYLMEAMFLFEAGISVPDIDEAMLDFGFPMGPLRLIDEVGVDVAQHVAQEMSRAFPDRMIVPQTLVALLEQKSIGRKAGSGFYIYGKEGVPNINSALPRKITAEHAARPDRTQLQERMVLTMLNEAARCLEEGVVSKPQDVDFAMVMGAGFAPFRGGPLRYADSIGIPDVVRKLIHRAETTHERCAPCAMLCDMAKSGKQFYA